MARELIARIETLYLKRYPIGPDEEDASWADGIDTTIVDVTPEKTPDDTANGT